MNKEELVKMTLLTKQKQSEIDAAEVWDKLHEAASAGKYECSFCGEIISLKTVEELRKQGFEVNVRESVFDEGGEFYQGGIEIYWVPHRSWIRKLINWLYDR